MHEMIPQIYVFEMRLSWLNQERERPPPTPTPKKEASADLALSCNEQSSSSCPVLSGQLWTALETMRDFAMSSSLSSLSSVRVESSIPSHFMCPISQVSMWMMRMIGESRTPVKNFSAYIMWTAREAPGTGSLLFERLVTIAAARFLYERGGCSNKHLRQRDSPYGRSLGGCSNEHFRPNTVVANDLDQATRIAYTTDNEFRQVVTLDGALFEKFGTMNSGGGKPRDGKMGTSIRESVSEETVINAENELNILEKSKEIDGIYGRLGDLGAIDAKYDVAISTACGRLDYIVVETTNSAEACVELLRRRNLGIATFMILEKQSHHLRKLKEMGVIWVGLRHLRRVIHKPYFLPPVLSPSNPSLFGPPCLRPSFHHQQDLF